MNRNHQPPGRPGRPCHPIPPHIDRILSRACRLHNEAYAGRTAWQGVEDVWDELQRELDQRPIDPLTVDPRLPEPIRDGYERAWLKRYPTPVEQSRERRRRAAEEAAEREAEASGSSPSRG